MSKKTKEENKEVEENIIVEPQLKVEEVIMPLVDLNEVLVEVKNTSKNELPVYAKKGDAGMDIRADFSRGVSETHFIKSYFNNQYKVIELHPGGRCLVPTGIHVAIPEGYEIQVRPRSGLALKQGLTVLNTPGTIDSGYRNEIGVIIFNTSNVIQHISNGDRIAQLVMNKIETIAWKEVEELNETERGETGFGDSGIK